MMHRLYVKFIKCAFGVIEIEYLGHVIGNGTVSMDDHKVSTVVQWLVLTFVKEI